ncbi:MAG: hypothetical protein IPP12_22425 [Nitrospira sp.]|nr:hypothetical protein [Nitrospira sp.]
MSLKEPIVEGAYYEREDGRIIGPAAREDDPSPDYRWVWHIPGGMYGSHDDAGINYGLDNDERLTRRVYITHTDPAEVVAELRRLEDEANAFICDDDDYREDNAGEAYGRAADLVESMLSFKVISNSYLLAQG